MTYCVAMALREGLLFASDSRTHAGVDHISTFCKMTVLQTPGERVIVMLNAGNLATSQQVVNLLQKNVGLGMPDMMSVPSVFDCATLVGDAIRQVINRQSGQQAMHGTVDFSCSFLVGGQIAGERPRLFLVYPEGNFIESTEDTPYFQIGESKYGKPIIDRVIRSDTSFDEALKCVLVSFDSTTRSNLSVGLPLDMALLRRDDLKVSMRRRIEGDDPWFLALCQGWNQGLRRVLNELPSLEGVRQDG
jgi:putative proteasome-type protease